MQAICDATYGSESNKGTRESRKVSVSRERNVWSHGSGKGCASQGHIETGKSERLQVTAERSTL